MAKTFSPINSETLVFIGAGATSQLGMPSTYDLTKILRSLCNGGQETIELLKKFFYESDLKKVNAFLKMLEGSRENNLEISTMDIEQAKIALNYSKNNDELLQTRILELRHDYDWNALKKILKICPHKESDDGLVMDVFSIIDKKLISGQSLKVKAGDNEEILSVSRLQGARNFLILFVNMLFSAAWFRIASGENESNFAKYKTFLTTFVKMMQKEGFKFHQRKYPLNERSFYLYTTSFVSFNFEMAFPWILMVSDHDANHRKTYIGGDHPLRLWLDFGCEHRGRKLESEEGELVPTIEFTESVVSRENEDGSHVGSEINRCGKFYFAHGSSNWRECPVCGRMTFYFGNTNNKWGYKSKELISPYPIPIFDVEENITLTKKEQSWHYEKLHYDALQCMHCGSETHALDAPMIMQTVYKSTPTSFLEEIQRNVKVSLEKARHIVLLGYRLPPDDTIWYQTFAEAIRSRINTEEEAFCSVIVGHRGIQKWLYRDELERYVETNRKKEDSADWGITAIENAWAIFGKKRIRAWTGGIPQVFGNGTENEVKELFYPSLVNWKCTRLEDFYW